MRDLGIDLGTTFSVLAVHGRADLAPDYPPGIYLEDCDATIIPSPEGEETFPSVVMEDPDSPGTLLYGRTALQRAEESGAPVLFSKRKMGTREPIAMPGGDRLARDIAREFLGYLKRCAEQALGHPVPRAVVTHPAYFDRAAVEETREAAREAGFDMTLPEQMLMEPVAAALAYTRTDARDPLRVLAYDLGGGTFDVTYLERIAGVIEMRAFDGDHLLGGYNFDRELAHWVRQRLEARGRRIVLDEDDPEDRARLTRLLRLAEGLKLSLAKAQRDDERVEFRARDVLVDTAGRPVQINESLTRAEFVSLIRRDLERTVACCHRALAKAQADPSAIDEVLLVGGSTYGPWVAESLAAAFPGLRPKLFHPDLCVGAGAAIHAKMVLPALVRGPALQLLLDVPETAVLEIINVAGSLRDAGGEPAEGVSVKLRLPAGAWLGPQHVGEGGRFLFPDVELAENAINEFAIEALSPGGGALLRHAFRIAHSAGNADISTFTTVLPRPLSILTFDGLIPLAREGATLPARCTRTFLRDNDNPHLTIELYQERDPIGEVRIENIPPEGGRGSFVDLEVEVTDRNHLRGTALVRTREGRVVARSEVSVHFTTTETQPLENLREQWEELEAEVDELLRKTGEVGDDETLAARAVQRETAAELLGQVDEMFERQPVERLEIQAGLARLRHLLHPPADEMQPPLEEFRAAVARCRRALAELAAQAEDILRASEQDRAMVARAKHTRERAGGWRDALERVEQQGGEAHARRDRRLWARAQEALGDLESQFLKRPKIETPPTPLSKIFAVMHVRRTMDGMVRQAANLASKGRVTDWEAELQRLHHGLAGVVGAIQAIDDDLPPDQGMAEVRIALRALAPIETAIGRLSFDLSSFEKPHES